MTDVREGRVLPVTDLSLVVLVGASGSGKSTFARRHFKPTEIISSDFCRGLVSDDENDQGATKDAFDVLHYIAGKRLAAGRRTVVDATSVQPEARRQLVELARRYDVLPIAIVLDVPENVCAERNAARTDRADMPRRVIQRHIRELRRSLRHLEREGFRKVHVLRGVEDVEQAAVVTEKRFNDLAHLTGPFDIIGDIHGCSAELESLLGKLGYTDGVHPEGRTAVFVGDLVDRGPDSPGVLRRVMAMVKSGNALCVPGNHENKYGRHLRGRKVQHTHGLAETIEQMAGESEEFAAEVREFIDGLVSHYVLDGGRLVVCHAGLPERYHGRTSGRVRSHALYGDTTGETDEFGLPVRYPWAEEYRGRAAVVYGHTPVPEATWLNNTICLDTGAVFGGKLTALRWPERELVNVPAERVWYEPAKPLRSEAPGGQDGRPLDLADVQGRRVVETRHQGRISIREENAAAALEVMSRFAVDPRLLPYLPPTMAPTATSHVNGYLEHPAEAFAQYAQDGVARVVCEEKHMGSRAVALVCRDADAARKRFGVNGPTGSLYTRTGRPFLDDDTLTEEILDRVRTAIGEAGLWDHLETDWLLLDAELMPWSLKASGLLRSQYAAVGAASGAVFPGALAALEGAAARGVERDRTAVPHPGTVRRRRRVHRGVPPLLLDHGRPGRRPPGTVPDPRGPGPQPRRTPARRAAHPARPARRARRQRPAPDHPAALRRHGRSRVRPGRCRLVAGDDRPRRRGHGRQAGRRTRPRQSGPPGAARHQVPRPRVPADHLRPRVHAPGEPGPPALAVPQPQAVPGDPRVRARSGGPGPAGRGRAAVAGARGGVRGAGSGVGAGGSASVSRLPLTSGQVCPAWDDPGRTSSF
ncbi:Bis(5'-nucleosyl)-tetraphosphatase, symmetrical [Streptomyces afghaniensis]